MTSDLESLPLFAWAAAQPPAPPPAAVHDLAEFRKRSARARLVHQPRETAELASLALDRCLGLAPAIPVAEFRPLRQA